MIGCQLCPKTDISQHSIGCVIAGSPAKSVTLNPFGTCIVRAASTPGNGFSTTNCPGFTAANNTATPLHQTAVNANRICISEA